MKDFALHRTVNMPRWWAVGSRFLVVAAVGLNFVGACGSVGSSVYFARAAGFYSAAAAAAAADSTYAQTQVIQGAYLVQHAASVGTVQIVCELLVLLLIVIAFSVVGVAGIRRVNAALSAMTNFMADNDSCGVRQMHEKGLELQRQIVGTVAVVFVSFLMRVIFSIMFALANALQNSGDACPNYSGRCDPICYNMFSKMQIWLLYTPEFQLLIVLISQPVALLVALWGMTSGRAFGLMKAKGSIRPDFRSMQQ